MRFLTWGFIGGLTLVMAACANDNAANPIPSPQADTVQTANPAPGADPQELLFTEHADNHRGVPVFADTNGAAVPDGVPALIPYGTAVQVKCYAPNNSGMASINHFYRIVGGKWDGMYAPANTFDNNAGMGPNTVALDPRVPAC